MMTFEEINKKEKQNLKQLDKFRPFLNNVVKVSFKVNKRDRVSKLCALNPN